jgi:hypothetical protein
MDKQNPETGFQKAIMDYLQIRGHFVWRNNTGGRPWISSGGRKRMMMFGKKGSGDILGVEKGTGRFISIEVKVPGNMPTDDQVAFMEEILSRGGLAFVASTVDDVTAHGL